MHGWSRLALAAVLVVGAGCASSGERTDREYRNYNLLTSEQIQEVRASNAYEVVQRLRSRWLSGYGSTQLPGGGSAGDFRVQVYLDGVHMGEIDRLREINYQEIEYIEYYPPQQASARFGFDHGAGAIMVSTRPLDR